MIINKRRDEMKNLILSIFGTISEVKINLKDKMEYKQKKRDIQKMFKANPQLERFNA